jgi:hypothetical protein
MHDFLCPMLVFYIRIVSTLVEGVLADNDWTLCETGMDRVCIIVLYSF